jgi:GNAT superfamily N-acetyltransferase
MMSPYEAVRAHGEHLEVTEAQTRAAFIEAYSVMHELRSHLTQDAYLSLVAQMTLRGYRLFVLRDGDTIVALAGVTIDVNFYHQRHVFVYDLVTSAAERSKGYGGILLGFVEGWAREQGCTTVTLASGLQRVDAHRFYETRQGFDKTGFMFVKHVKV